MSSVVEARGLSKRYLIGGPAERYGRLTESITRAVTRPLRLGGGKKAHLWALKDVDLDVAAGEVVGIIGRNGAGKTTLLKILSRITEPTEGIARLEGRVGSLLEVGTGFHPELTGRENVFLNGAILGMRRSEIARQFDEIVAFAEVEEFLDTPVKRYSSGMHVRLAFSVAAHLEAEVLIVDEVLAVGDASFQKKCLGKMDDVSRSGRTVLFVSHNMAAVENLCSRGLLLEKGRLAHAGGVEDVVKRYLETVGSEGPVDLTERTDRQGDGRLRFTRVASDLKFGSPGEIVLNYSADRPLRNVEVSLGLFTIRGEGALFLGNALVGDELTELPQDGTIVCNFDKVPLLPGTYSVNVFGMVNGVLADWIIDAGRIEVSEGDFFGTGKLQSSGYGPVAVAHSWGLRSAGN